MLKDAYNTSDLPTTGGSVALKDVHPAREAFVVERLRAAGAIILGKTTLTEMIAAAPDSSLGGRTSNPWDQTRTPGQTSIGTGAALGANFALLGTGTDNGQSVRSPASCQRPHRHEADGRPRQLRRRDAELAVAQLVRAAGPLGLRSRLPARCDGRVRSARLHDAPRARLDSRDLHAFLDPNGLRGARFGVVVELMGDKEENAEVNRVFNEALARMEKAGATVFPIRIPNMNELPQASAPTSTKSWDLFDQWFGELGPTVALPHDRGVPGQGQGDVRPRHRSEDAGTPGARGSGARQGVRAEPAQDARVPEAARRARWTSTPSTRWCIRCSRF